MLLELVMRVITKEDVTTISKNIVIPARPAILEQLHTLTLKADVDPTELVSIIGQDMGLAASVLKTCNSPLFRTNAMLSSISQAVARLGQKNIRQLATGFILRQSTMQNAAKSLLGPLGEFWDWSNRVAMISALIAQQIGGGHPEELYCFTLFRDCGIPVMLLRFKSYGRTLELAHKGSDYQFLKIEEELHACNHATVGYLVAKAWLLPDELCNAILQHHEEDVHNPKDNHDDGNIANLISISRMAEHIEASLHHRADPGWELGRGEVILAHLGLTLEEFEDLRDGIHLRFQAE
ncbi:HDOD domain-containing protein [Leeia oryzae]|uniref:HDOD domain-containing protein n=1 Tax=Leeia oryzae TaxID=356662 RepID=UPI001FDF4FC8|nr:HDOD domain-containing protein [Leeia oryzae]